MGAIHRTAATGFDKGAGAYARARPSYPPAVVDAVVDALGAGGHGPVLDLGAGTGKLTELLVARDVRCIGAEPVDGMRAAFSAALPRTPLVAATAEAIPFADGSISAVTVAQAFHWFRFPEAIAEIHRVLAHAGRLILVWNARDERVDWVKRITDLIDPYEGDVRVHRWRRGLWREPLWSTHLLKPVSEHEHTHEQEMDVEGLVERVASTSFVAVLPDGERADLLGRVRDLAATHPELAGRERFPFPYISEVYVFERTDGR